jgi:molybdopterin-containing oxidoreductase family membrane subunit
MAAITFDHLAVPPRRLWPVVAGIGAALLAGLGAFLAIEVHGHHVTGMTARIPWGLPHVFAYFLILAASGALNVAMIASVFGRNRYKPLEPFSALLAIALLVGGLAVLVLDLGRPDRLTVTLAHRNSRSIFAWNILLYTGFLTIATAHLVTLLDRRYGRFGVATAHTANLWRFVLTTGTGLDLGILVSRDLLSSAIMAPLFISFALTYGLAVFLLLLPAVAWMAGRRPDAASMHGLGRLLALLVGVSLYLTLVLHGFNLYAPQTRALERFVLLDGGVYTMLFWGGQVLLGTALPLLLVLRRRPVAAAAAVALGGLATLYLYIIAGQAFPQPLLPGMRLSSALGDGTVATYLPTAAEALLGVGGMAIALAVVLAGCLLFRIVPAGMAKAAEPLPAQPLPAEPLPAQPLPTEPLPAKPLLAEATR